MKNIKNSILLGFMLVTAFSFGQMRIVNTPNNVGAVESSAFVDASSNPTMNLTPNIGKGLLFPRTDLTEFSFSGGPYGRPNTYPTNYDGFIVYNTATSGVAMVGATKGGALFEGFWYYENKSTTSVTEGTWIPIGAGADVKAGLEPWFGTDDKMGATSNTEDIYQMGSVGIGTDAPTQKLEVIGNAQIGTAGREMRIGSMGYANHAGIAHKDRASVGNYALVQSNLGSTFINASTDQDVFLRINNELGAVLNKDKNFGIGTDAPTQKLEVEGNAVIGPNANKAMIGGADGWAGISHRDQGVIGGYALLQNPAGRTSINAATGQNISFSINNELKAMLTSAGNLGINVNFGASQKLDVGGRARIRTLDAGLATDDVVVADANGVLKKVPRSSVGGADGDAWGVNGEDKTSDIFRGGNVGIGITAAPTQKLEVLGNAQIGPIGSEMRIGRTGYANHAGIAHKDRASVGNYALVQSNLGSTYINASTGQDIFFRINNELGGAVLNKDKNFGIGTDMPTAKLDVNGKARIRDIPEITDTNKAVLVVDADGNVEKRTNIPFMQQHLNRNISPYTYNIEAGSVHVAFGAAPVRFGATFMISEGLMYMTGQFGGITITGQGTRNMTTTVPGQTTYLRFVYDPVAKTLTVTPAGTWYRIMLSGTR